MQTKDLLGINLEWAATKSLSLIDEMKDAPLTFPTPEGGNHPLWVLGHCAYAEGLIIQEKMLGKSNPLAEWKDVFGDGTEPVADADIYPPFDDVRARCDQIRLATTTLFDSLSDYELDTPTKHCEPEQKRQFGTYAQCFLFVANHWLMHRGQVADARRAAGRTDHGA